MVGVKPRSAIFFSRVPHPQEEKQQEALSTEAVDTVYAAHYEHSYHSQGRG